MISYAQNREDVLLWRVFKERRNGYYIDIGAQDPVDGSVTKWFYDQGWRGINVEPQAAYFQRLCKERERDTNVRAAVSSQSGARTLQEFPDYPGLATVDSAQVCKLASLNARIVTSIVPAVTLAELCQQYVREEIAFLKIDVEGHEGAVVAGADWQRFRPLVVLAEATEVCSSVPNHNGWEKVLLAAGYLYATFDGLNAYYVRKEDEQLVEKLRVPANVLDGFVPYLTKECLERNFGIGPRGLRIAQCVTGMKRWVSPWSWFSRLAGA